MENQTTSEPTTEEERGEGFWPELSGFERVMLGAVGLGGAAVGGIGLYSSYSNVTEYMDDEGFEHPALVPIAIDIAIPVFSLAYLLLIRMNMPLWWVRWAALSLVGVTVYLNVMTTPEPVAQVAHAALPCLWVLVTEICAHFYRRRIGRANGTAIDPIPLDRWFLSPLSTAQLWRHMRLWQITSYSEALDLKRRRLRAIAALRNRYGRRWRFKAPLEARLELALGTLTPEHVGAMKNGAEGAFTTPREAEEIPAAAPLPAAAEDEQGATFSAARDALAGAGFGATRASLAGAGQRELETTTEQGALPPGEQRVTLPEGDTPYPAAATLGALAESQPVGEVAEGGGRQPGVETTRERLEREEREESAARRQRRQDSYATAVVVVQELLSRGQPLTGPQVAEDERVPVGARSCQRYLQRMVDEGVIPEEAVRQ